MTLCPFGEGGPTGKRGDEKCDDKGGPTLPHFRARTSIARVVSWIFVDSHNLSYVGCLILSTALKPMSEEDVSSFRATLKSEAPLLELSHLTFPRLLVDIRANDLSDVFKLTQDA